MVRNPVRMLVYGSYFSFVSELSSYVSFLAYLTSKIFFQVICR